MTGPIKPTGGPALPPRAEELGATAEPKRADFRDALAEASQPAGGPAEVGPVDELSVLASKVRSGELSPEQAVDALVERALSSPMAKTLDAAGRAGLEAHLRSVLADDPVLGQIVGDLARS